MRDLAVFQNLNGLNGITAKQLNKFLNSLKAKNKETKNLEFFLAKQLPTTNYKLKFALQIFNKL